jgi:hypothetical protein
VQSTSPSMYASEKPMSANRMSRIQNALFLTTSSTLGTLTVPLTTTLPGNLEEPSFSPKT